MSKSTLISVEIFCRQYQLKNELITSLHNFGLIKIFYVDEIGFIAEDDLVILEKIVSFHNDLEINKEGIEVILRLLEQINGNLAEIDRLKNKLKLYESNE